jgi:hypothetical protein
MNLSTTTKKARLLLKGAAVFQSLFQECDIVRNAAACREILPSRLKTDGQEDRLRSKVEHVLVVKRIRGIWRIRMPSHSCGPAAWIGSAHHIFP